MTNADFEKEFVYKTTLKSVYGLTDGMIRELGEPDKRVKNPHWRSGPLASLYAIARVEAWCDQNRERLEKAAASRAKRQEAARRANETKYNRIMEWAQNIEIKFEPPATADEAWKAAENYYSMQDWYSYRGVGFGGVVAYLRHNHTNYERLLRQIDGQAGTHMAYEIIRERVDNLVGGWLDEKKEMETNDQSNA